MLRSYDHPQGAYIVHCEIYSLRTPSDLHRYVELVLWQHAVQWVPGLSRGQRAAGA